MITIEVAAKTVQKAIEEGLLKLNKSMDEVDIKIISSGGLFKKAKVEITVSEPEKPVQEIKEKEKPMARNEERRETQVAPSFKSDKSEQKPENRAKPFAGREQATQQPPLKQRQPEQKAQAEQKPEKTERKPFEQKTERTESKPFEPKQDRPERKPFEQKRERPSAQKSENPDLRTAQAARTEKGYQPFRQRQDDFRHHDKETAENGAEANDEHRQRPRAEITDETAKQAYDFVNELLNKMDITFTLSREIVDGELKINVQCDSGAVIGYRGETLDSIEYLTSLAINKNDDKYYKICIDCNDYRSKRVETLSGMAHRMAEKAVKTGRKVVLEPMSSSSRKIIHSVLSANDRIITKSEGREPNRRIVIIPKRYRQVNDKQANEN